MHLHIYFAEHYKSLKQPAARQHEVLRCKVLVLVLPSIRATERCFHGEYVGYVKLLKHCYSCRLFLILAHRKPRLLKTEVIAQLRHNIGKDSSGMRPIFDIVAIHKDVLPSRMPVEIAVQQAITLF